MHRFPVIFNGVVPSWSPKNGSLSVCTWTSLVILMGFLHLLFWVTQKNRCFYSLCFPKTQQNQLRSSKTQVNTQESYIIAPNRTIIAAGKALVWIMTAPNGTFGFTIQPWRFPMLTTHFHDRSSSLCFCPWRIYGTGIFYPDSRCAI